MHENPYIPSWPWQGSIKVGKHQLHSPHRSLSGRAPSRADLCLHRQGYKPGSYLARGCARADAALALFMVAFACAHCALVWMTGTRPLPGSALLGHQTSWSP